MLDLKLLQKNPEIVVQALKNRNSSLDITEFTSLDEKRRTLIGSVEALKAERNALSSAVAKAKKEGTDTAALMEKSIEIGKSIKTIDEETETLKTQVENWVLAVPNIPDASVPVGKTEEENVELHKWGTPKNFDFEPKEHWDIGVALGGIDFERASKVTGARFSFGFKWLPRLERALSAFFLNTHVDKNGYTEVSAPLMVNRATMLGIGQLPKFEEDLFKLENWDYYLIPTAEVPLTGLHFGETLEEDQLPLAYTSHTPCFRSEAGSYGKDTRGLIRQHQFHKVEMVRFAHPDDSFNQLEIMRGHAENLLQALEIPYRTITLCTGDMGFASCKTYDLEAWLPGQNTYREISSCSNCGDFQARRASIKFRPKAGKPAFVHTLNGSGLPIGRTLVAIIENGQQKDGSIVLPKILVPFMNGIECIEPK